MSDTTYITPVQQTGYNGQYFDVKFTFSHNGTQKDWNFTDYDMVATKFGALEYQYDIDEPLMVPGSIDMEVHDPHKELYTWFFGDPGETGINRQMEYQLRLNGNIEYIGAVLLDSVRWNESHKLISFTIAAAGDIINRITIIDDDGTELNPFSYDAGTYYTIVRFLEDIFKEVSSLNTVANGNLEIYHGWEFRGEKVGEPSTTLDFDFDELLFLASPFYFLSVYGDIVTQAYTCGELLRRLALDFGAYTGLMHNRRCFFKQLFYYDSGNTQTLDPYVSCDEYYGCNIISYTRLYNEVDGPLIVFDEGTYTRFEDQRFNRETLFYFFDGHPDAGDGSVVRGQDGGDNYQIQTCRYNPVDSNFLDHGDTLAKFWHHWRSDVTRCKIKKFSGCLGIHYDFLKDFTDGGEKFQIFHMRKDLDKGITDIEAFNLGV